MKNFFQLLLFHFTYAVLLATVVRAQDSPSKTNRQLVPVLEERGDAYLPNAWQNKRKSKPYSDRRGFSRRQLTPNGQQLTTSSIFTVQVNVDSAGQNILGDAANEPNLVVNPVDSEHLVIGWRQFDNVSSNFRQAGWAYSDDGGLTWTFPGRIEPGVFRSDPVLDCNANGTLYYNSLTVDTFGNYFCKVFESGDNGISWSQGTDARGGDKQWMAVDKTGGVGDGNIYSSWSANYSSCGWSFTRSTTNNTSYENCTYVDDEPFWLNMAVGPLGELYIAGGISFSLDIVVAKSINAQVAGSTVSWNNSIVFLDGELDYGANVNPGGLLGMINMDVDRSWGAGRGNVYVLASLSRLSIVDPGDVMFASSMDGGATWNPPVRVNDDASTQNTQWFGTISVAPNGRIDAIWLDTRDAPGGSDSSALYYSYSMDYGITWSPNEKMSENFDPHIGYPNQFKMGDYFDMVSTNAGVHVAWANTLNGEEDVYYSFITPALGTGEPLVKGAEPFSIFPNPTNGMFRIASSQSLLRIEIFNPIGGLVHAENVTDTNIELDFTTHPPGVYIVKLVKRDGSIFTEKIIRQ